MATTTELLRELFIANGLDKDEDTWELPMGKRPTIITRTGIEKIQFHNNIKVTNILVKNANFSMYRFFFFIYKII